MSTTYTQHVMTIDDYLRSRHPDELRRDIERSVRSVLAASPEGQAAGETRTGWLIRVGGYDVHSEDGRRWIEWAPGDDLPAHADLIACRARRVA